MLGYYPDEHDGVYCDDCGSCGEPMCCSETKCKYYRSYVVEHCKNKLDNLKDGSFVLHDSLLQGYRMALNDIVKELGNVKN